VNLLGRVATMATVEPKYPRIGYFPYYPGAVGACQPGNVGSSCPLNAT